MGLTFESQRQQLAAQRRMVAARGLASLTFALLTLLWPRVTVHVVVLAFAVYLVIDSALALWSVWRLEHDERGRPASALLALAELVAGIFALALPHKAAPYVAAAVGLWAAATGLLVLAGTLLFWRQVTLKLPLVLGSLLLFSLGAMLTIDPMTALNGVDGVLGFIAAVAAIAGALSLLLAYTMGDSR